MCVNTACQKIILTHQVLLQHTANATLNITSIYNSWLDEKKGKRRRKEQMRFTRLEYP